MSLLTSRFLTFLNTRPPRPLAPAPPAPAGAPCGHCDVPHAEHGVRYSAIPGYHTWTKAGMFLPLPEYRRCSPPTTAPRRPPPMTDLPYTYTDFDGDQLIVSPSWISIHDAGVHAPTGEDAVRLARAVLAAGGLSPRVVNGYLLMMAARDRVEYERARDIAELPMTPGADDDEEWTDPAAEHEAEFHRAEAAIEGLDDWKYEDL